MTAPRMPMQDLIRRLALREAAGQQPSAAAPQPMDIPATQRELDAFAQRGGRVGDQSYHDPLGSSNLPVFQNGTYGGEFSDEDWAAYLDAAKKLGFAKGIAHLQPLLALAAKMSQQPDATSVAPNTHPRY